MQELQKFAAAFRGIFILITREPHARVHAVIALAVIAAGAYFQVNATEWVMLLFAIAMVIAAEAWNTALEKLSDVVQPAQDTRIRDIKDIAAGAVLLSAIAAVVIGSIIFIPYLIR